MERTQPPLPHLGIGDCGYCYVLGAIAVRTQEQHKRVEVPAIASQWNDNVDSLKSGIVEIEDFHNVLFDCCCHQEQIAPDPGHHHNIDSNEDLVAVIVDAKALQHASHRPV